MATTRVIFNIPASLKKRAMARAKREGTTLTTIFTQAARAYGAGELDIEVVDERPLRPAVARAVKKAIEEAERGEDVDGPYTLEESQKDLRKLMR
jgi:hypothetical protein